MGKDMVDLDLRQNDVIWAVRWQLGQSRVYGIGYRVYLVNSSRSREDSRFSLSSGGNEGQRGKRKATDDTD